MNQEQYAAFKTLFKAYVTNPDAIDAEHAASIDALLDDIDRASTDHAEHIDSGGSHSGWLMKVLEETFGEILPEAFGEYGPIISMVASTLADLAASWLPRGFEQGMGVNPETAQDGERAEYTEENAPNWRLFKRAASAALYKVTEGKVPLEACVGLADMGIEILRAAHDVATGKSTPLEACARLTNRAVAVAGALIRQGTRIGAQAAGAALGAFMGQPALGQAIGRAVGEVMADTMGEFAEQGLRLLFKVIPPAARVLKSKAQTVLKNLKHQVWA